MDFNTDKGGIRTSVSSLLTMDFLAMFFFLLLLSSFIATL